MTAGEKRWSNRWTSSWGATSAGEVTASQLGKSLGREFTITSECNYDIGVDSTLAPNRDRLVLHFTPVGRREDEESGREHDGLPRPGSVVAMLMYHSYARRQIRRAYGWISTGQLDFLVAQFAPDALFAFPGEHVLGGEFRGPDAVRAWFTEVRRLFPDFRIEPRRIVVEGGPMHTHAATWFDVSGTFPDGAAYRNQGMQLLELRRGRVCEDRLFEDTKIVIDALDRLRALGMEPGATLSSHGRRP